MPRSAAALFLAIFLIGADSRADVVELRGGGQVEGTVTRTTQEKAPYAVVQVDPKLRIAIPESQIARVAASADLEEYSKQAKATPDDADAQYELARWCKGKTLPAQYRHHLQRAIAIDPDHAKARAALGFVDHEGKWIRYSQLQKERGLISVAGRYRLPEEVALLDAQSEVDVDAKRWVREISRLRAAVLRGGDKGAQASAALAAIEDPRAAPAMAAELVENVKQPQSLRLFWIERLYVFANRPALEALAKVGLNDPDSVIREKALEVMSKIAPASAIATYPHAEVERQRSGESSCKCLGILS
jgi:hypothetical protein